MKESLISVIVPVYKVEKYLDRCVESIIGQTYSNLEVILVDDGSPDHCPAMCDAWAKKDSRIKVIHKKNGGLSDARNAGMEVSNGDLIGFVDSDDWIAPDMYQCLYEIMKADNSDISACGVKMVWENGTASRMLTESGNCVLSKEEAMRALIEESWIKQPVWYKLYNADIIRHISFPVGKYHEDVFWSYQVIGAAGRVSVIDHVGYYYWQRSGSIMGEAYSLKRLDAIEAMEHRQDYLENNFPALATRARCSLWFSCMYHGQKILCEIQKKDQANAMEYLRGVIRRHPFLSNSLNELGRKEKIWLSIEKTSLQAACRIRNALGIGL
ncbi:glycosyltransferase [Fusibacillus kribbianus]|uniref:Glycosyltransferase n=1 Tax=Fusibacillus kribbianus TaxID=3044208 RepID=A0AAP4EY79_9FIRM|nr:glycosyltransferase [Ruminococcus sp. YH-rum2234]MDI9241556.1 glycosyltransferase [Ruminococcus sp. YH-rum2234]